MATQSNPNFYSLAKWQVSIPLYSDTVYFCKALTLPDTTINPTEVPNFVSERMTLPGDKVTYGNLIFTMFVQEDMKNYAEMLNWIRKNPNLNEPEMHDISVDALNNNYNKNIKFQFLYCYPTFIAPLNLDYGMDEREPPVVEVIFNTLSFKLLDKEGNEL